MRGHAGELRQRRGGGLVCERAVGVVDDEARRGGSAAARRGARRGRFRLRRVLDDALQPDLGGQRAGYRVARGRKDWDGDAQRRPVRLLRDGRAQSHRLLKSPHALVVARLARNEVGGLEAHLVAGRGARVRHAEERASRRAEAGDRLKVLAVVLEESAEVRAHGVRNLRRRGAARAARRLSAGRNARDARVRGRLRVAGVGAQRVGARQFELVGLARVERALDAAGHARRALVGARAQQLTDGAQAAPVVNDAHQDERHEGERDEDEQQLVSEVHDCHRLRSVPGAARGMPSHAGS